MFASLFFFEELLVGLDLHGRTYLLLHPLKEDEEDGYGYGLGQRCPRKKEKTDFGWGGAAGAYYAVDRENAFTVFLGIHVLNYSLFAETRTRILPLIKGILQ